jgi:hypothetical protein
MLVELNNHDEKPIPFGDKISLHSFSMTQMQGGGNWVSN